MALEMEDALAGNVAELGRFDGVERVLAGAKSGRACSRRSYRARGWRRARPSFGD
jgi:hypothetical protein